MKHRNLIIELIGKIIRGHMDKLQAVATIKQVASEGVKFEEQAKFLEVVESELMSLHLGNIARFRLKPSEYEEWLKTWR